MGFRVWGLGVQSFRVQGPSSMPVAVTKVVASGEIFGKNLGQHGNSLVFYIKNIHRPEPLHEPCVPLVFYVLFQ